MSPDLTVRRSHEVHERRMFKSSMSQVGESDGHHVIQRFIKETSGSSSFSVWELVESNTLPIPPNFAVPDKADQ